MLPQSGKYFVQIPEFEECQRLHRTKCCENNTQAEDQIIQITGYLFLRFSRYSIWIIVLSFSMLMFAPQATITVFCPAN